MKRYQQCIETSVSVFFSLRFFYNGQKTWFFEFIATTLVTVFAYLFNHRVKELVEYLYLFYNL